MPSKPENIYEYALLRLVPRVEREEFVNIGLLMMCKRRRWIRFAWTLDPVKLQALRCGLEREQIEAQLAAFESVAEGKREAGALAELPPEERFRWLAAVKSSCLQTSPTHPGLTDNLDDTFNRLYAELVL